MGAAARSDQRCVAGNQSHAIRRHTKLVRHHLGKAGAIGIVVPPLFLDHIPVALHDLRGTLVAKVAEVGIVIVKVGTEVPGLD